MKQFFHGWRRKAGVVTLVMALVVMVAWARSRVGSDYVALRRQYSHFVLYTNSSGINCIRFVGLTPPQFAPQLDRTMNHPDNPPELISGIGTAPSQFPAASTLSNTVWHTQFCGIQLGEGTDLRPNYQRRKQYLIVPYWGVILPLTLISAYLILWKPRKRI